MRRALIRKANVAYLAQTAPVGPAVTPPAGLLNLSPTNGGTVDIDLDSVATNIIASPAAIGELVKMKTATDSNVSLVGAGVEAPQRALLGVPVMVSNAMSGYNVLVLDSGSVLSAYGDVQLATSTDFYFGSDSVALRATFRFGAKIAHTDRVIKLTVAEPGS